MTDQPKHRDRGVTIDPDNLPPGLKRTEMSRLGKEWQLGDLGIRGKRAQEILDQIYGKEEPDAPHNPSS